MKTTTNTLPELKQLKKLAQTVRDTHEETVKLAKALHVQAHKARASALLCGKALLEAKELIPHGGFMAWVQEHCSGMAQSTANNYMRLASNSQMLGNLPEDDDSLIAAYVALGIVKPRKEKACNTKQLEDKSPTQSPDSSKPSDVSGAQPIASDAGSQCEKTELAQTKDAATSPSENLQSISAPESSSVSESAASQPTCPIAEPTEDTPFPSIGDCVKFVPCQMPTEQDPLKGLRALIQHVMTEIESFDDGMKGGIAEEIAPILSWAQCRGFC